MKPDFDLGALTHSDSLLRISPAWRVETRIDVVRRAVKYQTWKKIGSLLSELSIDICEIVSRSLIFLQNVRLIILTVLNVGMREPDSLILSRDLVIFLAPAILIASFTLTAASVVAGEVRDQPFL